MSELACGASAEKKEGRDGARGACKQDTAEKGASAVHPRLATTPPFSAPRTCRFLGDDYRAVIQANIGRDGRALGAASPPLGQGHAGGAVCVAVPQAAAQAGGYSD